MQSSEGERPGHHHWANMWETRRVEVKQIRKRECFVNWKPRTRAQTPSSGLKMNEFPCKVGGCIIIMIILKGCPTSPCNRTMNLILTYRTSGCSYFIYKYTDSRDVVDEERWLKYVTMGGVIIEEKYIIYRYGEKNLHIDIYGLAHEGMNRWRNHHQCYNIPGLWVGEEMGALARRRQPLVIGGDNERL